MFNSLGLHDAIQHLNGEGRPHTVIGSKHTIDYIFVSQNLLSYLVGAGQLVRDSTFVSDHPALYIQLDMDTLMSSRPTSIPNTPKRLRTVDLAATENFPRGLESSISLQQCCKQDKGTYECTPRRLDH